ncbi:hypothetical protein [Desulfococcus sp.]|uniref:hypothetical protein n=1 Tax=Desulfococcus sp. TaxID=2025834 RepID=UPI0035942D5F
MFTGNNARRPKGWIATAVRIIGSILVLGACSAIDPIVPPERRIPLRDGGAHSGQWKDMDASVWYRYTTGGQPAGKMRISGSVSARMRLDQLSVSVRFLDGGGEVLGSGQIYSSGYRNGAVGGEYDRTFDIPAGTEALTFASFSKHRLGPR